MANARKITLRSETQGPDQRNLWAYLDAVGDLRVSGQDLGPATGIVSTDGEYEWFQTIAAGDIPALIELLGGQPGIDILDLLADRYTGPASYDFERMLRDSNIPVALHVYSG